MRKTILDTFPDIEESFKNGVPWYEGKYYLVAFKDHVNIGVSVEGLAKEQMDLFEGKGEYMRHIKIFSTDVIDEKNIVKLLRAVRKKLASGRQTYGNLGSALLCTSEVTCR